MGRPKRCRPHRSTRRCARHLAWNDEARLVRSPRETTHGQQENHSTTRSSQLVARRPAGEWHRYPLSSEQADGCRRSCGPAASLMLYTKTLHSYPPHITRLKTLLPGLMATMGYKRRSAGSIGHVLHTNQPNSEGLHPRLALESGAAEHGEKRRCFSALFYYGSQGRQLDNLDTWIRFERAYWASVWRDCSMQVLMHIVARSRQ